MKEIPFTQYMMPDGRKREQFIERPDEIADIALAFIKSGGRFEMEMLSDYVTVSLTAERGDDVVAHELCVNGPEIADAVDKLILATKP